MLTTLWLKIDPRLAMDRDDRLAIEVVRDDIARLGFVVDRLRDIAAEREGRGYWRYEIPIRRVAA